MVLLVLWDAGPAYAATVDVCETCTFTTISRGVAAAGSGGTVRVAAGEYDEHIVVEEDVTLIGAGSGVTILRSSTSDEIVHAGLTPDYGLVLTVSISGFTLEPPSADGIVLLNTNATLSDIRAAGFGGTVVELASQVSDPVTLSVDGCVFSDNSVGIDGHELGMGDIAVAVSRSTFSGHTGVAIGVGGATARVQSSAFSDNQGAVATCVESLVVAGNTFSRNTSDSGPAVHAACGSSLTLTGNTFSENEAENGGAVYADVGSVTATRNAFTDNVATARGGAIWAFTFLDLEANTFSGNSAYDGGAVFTGLLAQADGNTFTDNVAAHSGAAIGAVGDVDLDGNTFCGNAAGTGGGVAVAAGSELEGAHNVFADNTATTEGADLHLAAAAALVNNTFLGGSAPVGGSVWSSADLDFRNNVLAYASGYGLYGAGGTATIAYNDFWEVVPDAVGGTWGTPDATNLAADPMLVSYVPGDCGALDAGLLAASPLVDAGDPSTTDADGSPADVGATGGGEPAAVVAFYRDADGDWYGTPEDVVYATARPAGYQDDGGDCDDANPDVHPYAREVCDGIDQDCDGQVDDGVTTTWRPDADADGFPSLESVEACEPPDGWQEDDGGPFDCDDSASDVFPGASEIPDDGIDQDCDGADELSATPDSGDSDSGDGAAVAGGGCRGCDDGGGGGPLAFALAALYRRGARRSVRARKPSSAERSSR